MAKVSFYLDERYPKADGCCTLKLVFRNRGTQAHLSTGYSLPLKCWDGTKVVSSKSKATDVLLAQKPSILNAELSALMSKATLCMQEVCGKKGNLSATIIKNKVAAMLAGGEACSTDKTFLAIYDEYIDTLENYRTRSSVKCPRAFIEKNMPRATTLLPCDIDESWGETLVRMMREGVNGEKPKAANSVVNYLTLIKVVWRYGQKKGYIDKEHNPLANVTAERATTKSKALEADTIRDIFNYRLESTRAKSVKSREQAVKVFKLSFLLCGINPIDLFYARESDIVAGRLQIERSKTGVPINILIPDEAWEIINELKKDGYLIGNIRCKSPELTDQKVNRHLKQIHDGLTMYYARHSWMSIGAELDIPDRVLFMGIAHKMGKYSDETYITMRHRKLDVANRKIIDYVLQKGEFAPLDNGQ